MNRPLLVLATFLLLAFLLIEPGSESVSQEAARHGDLCSATQWAIILPLNEIRKVWLPKAQLHLQLHQAEKDIAKSR